MIRFSKLGHTSYLSCPVNNDYLRIKTNLNEHYFRPVSIRNISTLVGCDMVWYWHGIHVVTVSDGWWWWWWWYDDDYDDDDDDFTACAHAWLNGISDIQR